MPQNKELSLREVSNREENKKCIDCGMARPQWASVTYGIFLCLNCAGTHRSYGVRISMVKSVGMDVWAPAEIKKMEIGGNKRFAEWVEKHSLENLPKEEIYQNKAVKEYRNKLQKEINELFPELEKKDPVSPKERKKTRVITPSPATVDVSGSSGAEQRDKYVNRYSTDDSSVIPSMETIQTGITEAFGRAAEYFYSASSTISGHLSEKVINPASSIIRERGTQIAEYIRGKESNRRAAEKHSQKEPLQKKTEKEGSGERSNRSFDKWD